MLVITLPVPSFFTKSVQKRSRYDPLVQEQDGARFWQKLRQRRSNLFRCTTLVSFHQAPGWTCFVAAVPLVRLSTTWPTDVVHSIHHNMIPFGTPNNTRSSCFKATVSKCVEHQLKSQRKSEANKKNRAGEIETVHQTGIIQCKHDQEFTTCKSSLPGHA